MKILYYVSPLHGIGPFTHAQLLAEAAKKKNVDLTIALGDTPPKQIDLGNAKTIELPPIHAENNTWTMLKPNNQPIDDAYRKARKQQLLQAFTEQKPDVVLLHNYLCNPDSHTPLEFEIEPLIEAAKKADWQPKVVSTLMDFNDGFEQLSLETSKQFLKKAKPIDIFLIRGHFLDAFLKYCPQAYAFLDKLKLVGYPSFKPIEAPETNLTKKDTVVVSAGGSDLAFDMFQNCITTFQKIMAEGIKPFSDWNWHILVGPKLNHRLSELQAMGQQATQQTHTSNNRLVVEQALHNEQFRDLLTTKAALSISEIGQNTFVNLEQAKVPAVLVPAEEFGGEASKESWKEQLYRGELMEEKGRGVVAREHNLTPESLINAMKNALATPLKSLNVNLNGAETTLDTLEKIVSLRH